jgi:hypothetical protein
MSAYDLSRGKKIVKTPTRGLSAPTRAALRAFAKVQKMCEKRDYWARQIPWNIRMGEKHFREHMRHAKSCLDGVIEALGASATEVFASLGFPKPVELRRKGEPADLRRLVGALGRSAKLRALTRDATPNLRFYAEQALDRARFVAVMRVKLEAVPREAAERQRIWLDALGKLEASARRAGEAIRTL